MKKQSEGAARLSEWLEAKGVSLARLCADIAIHPLTPSAWKRGKKPTLAVAVKIERYTEGAVTCAAWISEASS